MPFFPPHFVEAVASAPLDGSPEAYQWLDGTLAVVDMKGFSASASQIFGCGAQGDTHLIHLINGFFEIVLQEIAHFGGSAVSFDGDALSVFFHGLDHAERALAAAVVVKQEVGRTCISLPIGDFMLQASIGISSGTVLSMSVPSKTVRTFALLGRCGSEAVKAQKGLTESGIAATRATLERSRGGWRAIALTDDLFHIQVGDGVALDTGNRLKSREIAWDAEAVTDRAEGFLGSHFPPRILQQILEDRISTEQRPIAALFVNVDGLGNLVDARAPNAGSAISHFFDGVLRIAARHAGMLNKINAYTTGDKYLILFGLSALPCANPAESAFEAALELQDWARIQPFPLRQRVGFGEGLASECFVGDSRRHEFTVIGRPVNEAVHLMEMAKWGEVATVWPPLDNRVSPAWCVRGQPALLKGSAEERIVVHVSPRNQE